MGDLLVEASKVSHHKEFVVIGSLSVLASTIPPPSRMLMSVDVDFYPCSTLDVPAKLHVRWVPTRTMQRSMACTQMRSVQVFLPCQMDGSRDCAGWSIRKA